MMLGMLVQVQALTLENVTLSSSSSNTSLSFSDPVNSSAVYLGSDYVALDDFIFNDSRYFWTDTSTYTNNLSILNWTESDSLVDSSDFINYFRFYSSKLGAYLTDYTFGVYNSITDYLLIY